jgi:hypothetical protein
MFDRCLFEEAKIRFDLPMVTYRGQKIYSAIKLSDDKPMRVFRRQMHSPRTAEQELPNRLKRLNKPAE